MLSPVTKSPRRVDAVGLSMHVFPKNKLQPINVSSEYSESLRIAYYSKVVLIKKFNFSIICYIFSCMNIFAEIVKRRSSPGVLVLDMDGHLLYSNEDALELITSFVVNDLAKVGSDLVLPDEITTLHREATRQLVAPKIDKGGHLPHSILVSEAGLALSLRAFPMRQHGKGQISTHVMVLMERIIKKHEVNLKKAEKDFLLSRRETEVLKFICQGNANREIANNMFICEDTVKGHIKKIMHKMAVNSRSEIIVALK